MFPKLVSTTNDSTRAMLRVVLGVIFFAHGAQRMLGWFGGYGFSGTMGFFNQMGIPVVLAILAISVEFFGSTRYIPLTINLASTNPVPSFARGEYENA